MTMTIIKVRGLGAVTREQKKKSCPPLQAKSDSLIIECLEHYHTSHEERLHNEQLTEDEVADLTNDYQYLEAIKMDLKSIMENC